MSDRPSVAATKATVIWDDRFLEYDFGSDHPFSEESRRLGVRLLADTTDDAASVRWIGSATVADRATLSRFHGTDYLDFLEQVSFSPGRVLLDAGDTPSFPGCFEASARIVGGTLDCLTAVQETGRPAFNPAGGLHHATPERASGFCVMNDLAVAIRTARAQHLRVAYIDIDAHHGDGVMYGAYQDGGVLDIDFHQDGRTLFPGTGAPTETGTGDGAGSKVNVPLPPGAGDEALLPLFRRIVPPLVREFRPDLILLQHGVDGHVGDALAQLQYTPPAYAEVDRIVLGLAKEVAGGHLVVTGGGGYRAESVARVLARCGRILAGWPAEPLSGTVLPEDWRADFAETTGEEPPERWETYPTPAGSPWTPERGEKLAGTLESVLGRRFPPADD